MPHHKPSDAMGPFEPFALACGMLGPVEIRAVHRGTGNTHTIAAAEPVVFVGRARFMGVQLDDPTVSQCHAYLQVVAGEVYCIDLGSRTGVVWDDGTRGRGWVRPEHLLRMGVFDLQVRSPAGDSTSLSTPDRFHAANDSTPKPFEIEVHSPASGSSVRHSLDQPVTLIGRHPNCDIRLLDESVAYFQCALVTTADGVWCVDILTRRGTVLNGRPTRLARLYDGDLLELGKVPVLIRSGRPSGFPLIPDGTASGNLAAIPQQVAESVSSVVAPFQEVMKQFQQCFATMAQMFTVMQQEHASMMGEQMRLIQELSREMRELRAEPKRDGAADHSETRQSPATPPPPDTPAPQHPTPRVADGPVPQSLADAHHWFLDRLAKMEGSPSAPQQKGSEKL